ncbi:hypothetical protein LINPERHAP1_LOCUS13908 [Linum perenne]
MNCSWSSRLWLLEDQSPWKSWVSNDFFNKGIHRPAFTSFRIFLSDRRRLPDDYSAQTWRILMNCFSCINPRRKAIKIDIDNATGCSTFRNSSTDPSGGRKKKGLEAKSVNGFG